MREHLAAMCWGPLHLVRLIQRSRINRLMLNVHHVWNTQSLLEVIVWPAAKFNWRTTAKYKRVAENSGRL